MECKCGGRTNLKQLERDGDKHLYRECPYCLREMATGIAADLLNEHFAWERVGWYQDTLHPIAFLNTEDRLYDLCLLRRPERYIAVLASATKYLHGLIEADGNMIINDKENKLQS